VRSVYGYILLALATACVSAAQDSHSDMNMPGMTAPAHEPMNMQAGSFLESIEQHTTSGTDAQPTSTPSEMLMRKAGKWVLMLHGEAFLNSVQQSGPRGADKFFSTNWLMPMAQRKLGRGTLTL